MKMGDNEYYAIKQHASLKWIRIHNPTDHDIIKAKILEAIPFQFYGKDIDDNVKFVAGQLGISLDNKSIKPIFATGQVHVDAVKDIAGGDKHLAAALTMVFNKTALGRSAPGTTNVRHIHIKGNAEDNLLFDLDTYTVLGTINFHIEKGMNDEKRHEVEKVTKRKGGTSIQMQVNSGTISKV